MLRNKKILTASSVGLTMVLILTLALSILSRAFATVEQFGYVAGGLFESDEQQTVDVSLIANEEIDVYALGGDFAVSETTSGDNYFTLTELNYAEKFDTTGEVSNEVDATGGRFFWTATGDDTLVFAANEVILTGTYQVAASAPAGTYNIELDGLALDLAGSGGAFSGALTAQVTIAAKTAQDISYADTDIEKHYGDQSFVNELTETVVDSNATLSFESENESVATVDELGTVTIIGVGNTVITATVSETGTHAADSASYDLTVLAQDLSIVSVSVPDKIYDGTTNTEVGMVVLSDESLVQNVDYTVVGVLNNAKAGTGRTATVTVTLADEIADNYNFATNTYEVSNITITPHTLTEANIALEYDTVEYDNTDKEPGVTVKIGDFVVPDTEYTVGYENNHNPGTATVTVTAKDNMNISGASSKNFMITQKYPLVISGIEDQTVAYTGFPVDLVGNLTVADNPGGIAVENLTVTWYAADGVTVIERPNAVGVYSVVYSYTDDDYEGELSVDFEIIKATSPNPAEVTANLKIEAGLALTDIAGTRSTGFSWDNDSTVVEAGAHNYAATYTYNGDTTSYTTINIMVPVYGLTRINIDTTVDGDGGSVVAPTTALEDSKFTVKIVPEDGYEIKKVTLNNLDITANATSGQFEVTAGKTDVAIAASFRKNYEVTDGDGDSYIIGTGETATFVINADYTLFVAGGKLYIDNELVDPSNYTVASGSTIITLSADYLKTLSSGEHTLVAVFGNDGIARASFTLASSSKTPVATPDTGYFTMVNEGVKVAGGLAVVVGILVGALILAKQRMGKSKIDFDKK